MKKSIILLLISLLIPIVCFSETTYPTINNDSLIIITKEQLKTTNLIFVEHEHLLIENEELTDQIDLYEELSLNHAITDSINTERIKLLEEDSQRCYDVINSQNLKINSLQNTNKILTIGSITVSVVLILFLLLK